MQYIEFKVDMMDKNTALARYKAYFKENGIKVKTSVLTPIVFHTI